MLDQDGTISFTTELADLIDEFINQYETAKGPLGSDLEKGLMIAYVLGVIRCDMECTLNALGSARVFRSLKPRALFEECVRAEEMTAQGQREELAQMVKDRGWLDFEES